VGEKGIKEHDRKKIDKFGRNKGKGKKLGISEKKLKS
jgi:hypothetical protein